MNGQNSQTIPWKIPIITFLLFFILGLSIRTYNLGSHNLWFDECATRTCLNFTINRIPWQFNLISRQFNCKLYYILLKFWTMYFGKSEFALRSLSMIFGVLSMPLIYKLGREFFNTKTGLVSAFILSISPMHIWYSQEARGYSLSTLLVMLMVYFFISALKKNRVHLWIGFVVSSILGIYTNYFCFYIIIITSTLLFLRRYEHLLKWRLASFCCIWIASLPIIPHFIKQLKYIVEYNFWIPKPHLNSIAITFENFNIGYNATPNIYFFTFLIFSLLFILGIKRWWKEKREELIYLISFLFIPIISTFLISQKIPVYLDRQLMFFSPFYYIIIAAGLTRIKLPMLKTAAYLSILVPTIFCLYNYFFYRMPLPQYHHIGVHVKKPVKPAADYINERFIQGDVVGFSGPSGASVAYYMIPKLFKEKIDIFSFVVKSKLDKYWRKTGERIGYGIYIGTGMPTIHAVILDEEKSYKTLEEYNFKRLWVIFSSWARDGILDSHAQAVRGWMQNHYSTVDTKEFDGIFVDLYTKKI